MPSRPRLLRALLVVGLLCPIGLPDPNLSAQAAAVKDPATDPEVKAAQRLFWRPG